MYKIGDFSVLSKTTIKTLRYYEKEGLLLPIKIDDFTGYRYYDTKQLLELSKIISLRQVGLSIKNIKKVLNGEDYQTILINRKKEIENDLSTYNMELSKINYLLEENNMNNEIIVKEIPAYIVYYRDGVIKDFGGITDFVLSSGNECREANPDLKCTVPNYCYISYLDGEYKESNIKIRYAEAVENVGKATDNIKFMEINPVTAICIYHKGAYGNMRESYNAVMKYVEDNKYEIADFPREHYIDGCWNKENEEEYLTEIQVPIKKTK